MIYPKRKLKVKWKKEVRTNLKSKMKANSQAKVVKTKTMDTVTKKKACPNLKLVLLQFQWPIENTRRYSDNWKQNAEPT